MRIAAFLNKVLDRVPRMPWHGDPYEVVVSSLKEPSLAEGLAFPDGHPDDITRLFFERRGRVADKWMQYLPVYQQYFGPRRGTPVRMLEIGVNQGGSLQLWREFLGPQATIFGIDINPACTSHVEAPNQVRIGSQADPAFLARVVEEMGGVDIVLDDGSHIVAHQRASFEALFPLLNDGGIYVIEDLQTSYWSKIFHGGYRRRGSGIELLKSAVDDMHHWYHDRGFRTASRGNLSGVHFHEGIAVVEKRKSLPPIRTLSGDRDEVMRLLGQEYRG